MCRYVSEGAPRGAVLIAHAMTSKRASYTAALKQKQLRSVATELPDSTILGGGNHSSESHLSCM